MKTLTRSFLAIAILAAFALLTGCGGSGQTPVGVQIAVSVSANPSTINQGGTSTITATVTGDTTNAGVSWTLSGAGSLTGATTTSVTYNAPATLIGTATPSITATSKADTSVTNSVQITVIGVGVSVTASPNPINAGQASNLTATVTNLSSPNVTWSLSPSTFGTLGSETNTTAVYTAPATVTTSTNVTITATSKVNTQVSGSVTITVNPAGTGNNVADLVIDGGPLPSSEPYPNAAFATATICEPGSTTNCATIDHLLVDTGSFGVRVLQSALGSVSLTPITLNGATLNNCVEFGDGSFLWGTVAPADFTIAGEKASSIPIHVVADPPGGPTNIPSGTNGCTGSDEDSLDGLIANGIIGVGLEPTDCVYNGVNGCDGSSGSLVSGIYYWCSGPPNCTTGVTAVPASQQVTNPIVMFPTDNNGSVMTFPSAPTPQATGTGTITFGIGTQSDNSLGAATVYAPTAGSSGWVFTTAYNNFGMYLPFSFIDSGSSALYVQNPGGTTITVCSDNAGFFCPSSNLTNQSATNTGANNASGPVSFEIDNADSLPTTDFVLFGLAGPFSTATDSCPSGNSDANCAFDWGLPFFYGRTVFTAIDGSTVSNQSTPTPWWAY
jgi:hypothetical protein